MNSAANRVLLHTIKHNPSDGEVYITFEGETFVGLIQHIEVSRNSHEPAMFSISGFVRETK